MSALLSAVCQAPADVNPSLTLDHKARSNGAATADRLYASKINCCVERPFTLNRAGHGTAKAVLLGTRTPDCFLRVVDVFCSVMITFIGELTAILE